MFVKLIDRLKNTRDNLLDVCEELGHKFPNEDQLPLYQCVNCYIWLPKRQFVLEDEMPVCNFCADMETLRF